MSLRWVVCGVLALGSFASAQPMVLIDSPGNPPGPNGLGAVDSPFRIGVTEVTNDEYAAFLNAVAAQSDPHQLWRPDMAHSVCGGIARSDRPEGGYVYAPMPGWANRPVAYLSWYSLARMANWMHYGMPKTGASTLGTTEGTDAQGAYDTRAFPPPGQEPDYRALPERRNPGATHWIPNQNEWYKAAYYDPTRLGERPYWDFATRSSSPPQADDPPGGPNSAAYLAGERMPDAGPFYLPEVTAYAARSYFGTLGQAGSLWEWVEDWRSRGDGKGWRRDEWTRGLRGGSFVYTEIGLHARNTDPGDPAQAFYVYGGRLARAATPPQTASLSVVQGARRWAQGAPRRELVVRVLIAGVLIGAGGTLALGLAATALPRLARWARSRRGQRPRHA